MDVEAIKRYNSLLREADRILAQLKPLMKSIADPHIRQKFHETYMSWYTDCLTILPDDVRPHFEQVYAEEGGLPNIRQMMNLLKLPADESNTSQLRNYFFTFKYPFEDMVRDLVIARRPLFTRSSRLPSDVREALATVCMKTYRRYNIKSLFLNNGCAPTWWMHPVKPTEGERKIEAFGWLDGILLHAPEQELTIVRAVCEDMLRKTGTSSELGSKVQAILATVSNLSERNMPVRDTESVSSERQSTQDTLSSLVDQQHQREIIKNKKRRLQFLEQQQARKGYDTEPHVVMEIEDLRREISELEQ